MGILRSALLASSENAWLRERAMRAPAVKRAVARFMPGERAEDAIDAASRLRQKRIGVVLTELGENVTDRAKAREVADRYAEVLERIRRATLDGHISVKLTHLGLDVDRGQCEAGVRMLAERARQIGTIVWIDMEQHIYVDRTLEIYRRVLAEFPNVGVCLQAYLYRTPDDVAALAPLGGGIRLVKGAYREPASVAIPKKKDVDARYLDLAKELLAPGARADGLRAVFGTHDQRLIAALQAHAEATSTPRDAFEIHLLFGIQASAQERLAADGYRVKVLISYGEQWFPWYMRRLAERPANLLFAVKSVLSR